NLDPASAVGSCPGSEQEGPREAERPPRVWRSATREVPVCPPGQARVTVRRGVSHVEDSEADAILAQAVVMHYSEGGQIFAKGHPGDSMMAVLHGRVAISEPSLD